MRLGKNLPTSSPPHLRVLNLGAGVQSSTVLMLADENRFENRPDVAIFADTGYEPPAVYRWLDQLEGEVSIPVDRVSAGNIRDDVLGAVDSDDAKAGSIGQPPFYVRDPLDAPGSKEGRLWRKCTRDYKIDPIRRRIRELLGVSSIRRGWVEQWYGISTDESQRMREPRDGWAVNYYPLIELRWRRSDCLAWWEGRGLPSPPRSACIACPFHSDAEWRRMRDEDPESFADAVDFDRRIRRGIPGVKGEAYVHRSTVPLDEVPLDDETGQASLWGGECEGLCGV